MGREIAKALKADGHKVVVHQREAPDHPVQLNQLMAQVNHGNFDGIVFGNCTWASEMTEAMDTAAKMMGGIDVLVNCASGAFGKSMELKDAYVGVGATMTPTIAALPWLKGSEKGTVINLSDYSVVETWDGFGYHSLSKQWIEAATLEMHRQYGSGYAKAGVDFACLRLPTVLPPDNMGQQALEGLEKTFGPIATPELATKEIIQIIDRSKTYGSYLADGKTRQVYVPVEVEPVTDEVTA